MFFANFISKQARKPSGLFGRFFMSKFFEKGNIELNHFVKDNLDVISSDRILEIGCGPGALLNLIARELQSGMIEGIDFSKPMISAAQKKNIRHIRQKKAQFRSGDFNYMEFSNNSYDKIFTVNTIYFWKDPQKTVNKISDLLKSGGKVVIGFHSKDEMKNSRLNRDIFRFYSPEEVSFFLESTHAFNKTEIHSKSGKVKTNFCVIGIK